MTFRGNGKSENRFDRAQNCNPGCGELVGSVLKPRLQQIIDGKKPRRMKFRNVERVMFFLKSQVWGVFSLKKKLLLNEDWLLGYQWNVDGNWGNSGVISWLGENKWKSFLVRKSKPFSETNNPSKWLSHPPLHDLLRLHKRSNFSTPVAVIISVVVGIPGGIPEPTKNGSDEDFAPSQWPIQRGSFLLIAVDGSEIPRSPVDMVNILCKYPIICRVFAPSQVVQDFFHQQ